MDTWLTASYAVLLLHTFACLMLAIYGVHRYHLVYLYYKHRRNKPRLTACFRELPRVTIQLPMFNERSVAARIIEATCQVDYPRDRLEIQVLDDSTDETVRIARNAVERMRAAGHPIVFLHRDQREGFKAGALAEGMKVATGEFILIFDADFIPPPDLLKRTIHHFTDPQVGMVQARWEHLNREHSLLTKTQAVYLDGHFVIEHTARNRSGRFMSFNGTAGIWRRTCIEDAGGWHHDTLTEDLDLSYRAQLRGWKFVYLPEITSPAELPPEMNAFKSQQRRWSKGGAQTCRKLLPRILASRLPLKIKTEAFFHLTGCTSTIYVVLLTLLLFPVLYMKLTWLRDSTISRILVDSSLFLIATCSASTFYIASQREVFRTWGESLKYLPFLMSLGVGTSLNNARATIEGLLGHDSEFERTPKFGDTPDSTAARRPKSAAERRRSRVLQGYIELLFGIYLTACVVLSIRLGGFTWGLPFLILFAVGYVYVSILTLYGQYLPVLQARRHRPATATVERVDPISPPR
ncbi:MAG: glycosyltransferase family 2 protein [Phycisphaerae bacterium]|nr:glycosyltransferase family 2 protein [Phycisphaerae bacterium]